MTDFVLTRDYSDRRRLSGIAGLVARLDRIEDRHLFALTVAWVIGGGLVLQLFVLPYLVPSVHWGHGLITDQDSLGYHVHAAERAERIARQGWGAWELRPEGHFTSGLASIGYALVRPEPWTMLPLNGVFFAIAVTSVRRLLTILFESRGVALGAVLPFFVFPSFVPIWGQLQKDVITGAGLSLVLYAVLAASYKQPAGGTATGLLRAGLDVVAGMALVWLARPYGMTLVAGGVFAAGAVAMISRRYDGVRLTVMLVLVVLTTVGGFQGLQSKELPPDPQPPSIDARALGPSEPPSAPTTEPDTSRERPSEGSSEKRHVAASSQKRDSTSSDTRESPAASGEHESAGLSNDHETATPVKSQSWLQRLAGYAAAVRLPRTRRIEADVATYGACAPYPSSFILDKMLFSLCTVREGFIGDAKRRIAASGVDYDIRLRTVEDFVAYVPRALGLVFFEPLPTRWGAERSPIGRLGSMFVPFEMGVAYLSFVYLALFAWKRLRRLEIWAIVAFCLVYSVTFAYTMPQLGTVYRMRAFAFSIVVGIAFAVFLSVARSKAYESGASAHIGFGDGSTGTGQR